MSDNIKNNNNDELNEDENFNHDHNHGEDNASVNSDTGNSIKQEELSATEEEKIDFDKEIENLDEFLMESEEDEDLALQDDEILTASSFSKSKDKRGSGKFVSYLIFLLLLGGLLYGGVVYGPQMFSTPELDTFQTNMANRVSDFEKSNLASVNNSDEAELNVENNMQSASEIEPASEIEAVEVVDIAENVDTLPLASDEEIIVVDNEEVILSTGEETITENNTNETATTIADALAITQNATTEEMPVAEVEGVLVEVIRADDNFERTPAVSLSESRSNMTDSQDNLPPLEDDQIKIANDVMQMPEEEIAEVVDAVDQVAENTKNEASKTNITLEAEETLVEEAIEETIKVSSSSEQPVNSEEITAIVTAETKKVIENAEQDNSVVEVSEVSDIDINVQHDTALTSSNKNDNEPALNTAGNIKEVEPKEIAKAIVTDKNVSNESPVIVSVKQNADDPRIAQAQTSYKAGDYSQALDLYNAILVDDATNTSALTGRQLSRAKMRMEPSENAAYQSQVPTSVVNTSDLSYEPISTTSASTTSNAFDNVAVTVGETSRRLRSRLQAAEVEGNKNYNYGQSQLNSRVLKNGTDNVTSNDNVLLPQPKSDVMPVETLIITAPQIKKEEITFNTPNNGNEMNVVQMAQDSDIDVTDLEIVTKQDNAMPVMVVESKPIMVAPEPALVKADIVINNTTLAEPSVPSELQAMIIEADGKPQNAALAVTIANMFKEQGNNAKAREWYKKALQRDTTYKVGLDRMHIYDSLAGVK